MAIDFHEAELQYPVISTTVAHEKGWPIDVRVGRHTSTALQILEIWSGDHPEKAVVLSGVPRYTEVVEKGTGAFLKDPKTAPDGKLFYE